MAPTLKEKKKKNSVPLKAVDPWGTSLVIVSAQQSLLGSSERSWS